MPKTLLDHLLATHATASRTTLRNMLRDGRIWIDDEPAASMKQIVEDSAIVRVGPRAARAVAPTDLNIVHEDADILVIDKPAGLITSSTPREPRPTLIAMVRRYLEPDRRARAGLIHRLDRDACGLLVFTRNHDAYANVKRQFFHRTTERIYLALVHGVMPIARGRIESALIEFPDGRVRSTKQTGKGEHAITDFEVLATKGKRSLVKVILNTGRKHQIRVHLYERGYPIVGDVMYGPPAPAEPQLMLVAWRLALDHPRTGERLVFERQPLPMMRDVYDPPAPV